MKTRKSNKQRRAELLAQRRLKKQRKKLLATADVRRLPNGYGTAPVDVYQMANYYGYGAPDFISRGFYIDVSFVCKDCGAHEVWTAQQQKRWYEDLKGDIYAYAVRCSACRKVERERKATARRLMREGLEQKAKLRAQQGNIDWKQVKLERAALKRKWRNHPPKHPTQLQRIRHPRAGGDPLSVVV